MTLADVDWENIAVCRWPEVPALPECACPVIVRVGVSEARQAARAKLRAALGGVLAAWSGLPAERLSLIETARGPVWEGLLHGHSLDISVSYGGGEGWIGLMRGGQIGIDVMTIEPIAEANAVARCYLGDEVASRIREAEDPVVAFARAWTEREARIKCLHRSLAEWTADGALEEARCVVWQAYVSQRCVGMIACA